MLVIYGLIMAVAIILDQLTKYFAASNLQDGTAIHIIGNFLRFSYLENRGAAFGILQNQQTFFVIITIVFILCILIYLLFNKKLTRFSQTALVLIISGAIGNFIDRVRLNYVVDFIDVRFGRLYDFPVFNLADCFVVIGTFTLIILILINKFEKSEKINE